ncbi:hypothetical protein EHE21_06625 [Proteus sp. GOKU]|uniref:HEPN domain-containing protein n=1 Tax=Proteus TaxID=583 RepID=UPI001892D128|nr:MULTISPECIES: HEPN domain-containing protein [Proteus]QPB79072.1 hypothetical protein EHE21_06625 [Proteus sp. GOKU]QQP25079.1 hypothetical protein D7029_06625 [Proteus vulgaris]
MLLQDIINEIMALMQTGTHKDIKNAQKYWSFNDKMVYVNEMEKYNLLLEKIYELDKKINNRFYRSTIFKYLNEQLPKIKIQNKPFNYDLESFFKDFYDVKPQNLVITAPISGIRLNNGIRSFELSCFKFGYLKDLEFPITGETEADGMYISTIVKNIYDKAEAIQKAKDAFLNFAKMIVFISGKLDKNILIETGLPLKPSLSHEQMYVSTSSYQVSNENGPLESAQINNQFLEKIPVNDPFFCNSRYFKRLWDFYEKKHNSQKLNDIESRILNSALALGESALTTDTRNSIIYTCISLEILFSLDDGSLFQKSIGEKLSDVFSFIVAKDVDSRLEIGKLVKKVYGLRSAIVHGGKKELSSENLVVNIYMRAAINEILNNEIFSGINKLQDIYDKLKRAQNSY